MARCLMIFAVVFISGFNAYAQSSDSLSVFPNPFVDSTQITLYNLENDTTTLTIYTVDGGIVAQPIYKQVLSGTVVQVFKADTLDNGVYMVHLETNFGAQSVVKMLKSNTVSIVEHKEKNSITLFPNPVHDKIIIQTMETILKAELFNLAGSKVKSWRAKEIKCLEISDLERGCYILHLSTSIGISTHRLTVE